MNELDVTKHAKKIIANKKYWQGVPFEKIKIKNDKAGILFEENLGGFGNGNFDENKKLAMMLAGALGAEESEKEKASLPYRTKTDEIIARKVIKLLKDALPEKSNEITSEAGAMPCIYRLLQNPCRLPGIKLRKQNR